MLWVTVLLLVALTAWQARFVLLPFMIGTVVAYALAPVVDRIASVIPARTRRADVWRRGVVVLVIYIAFFGSIAGVVILLAPLAAQQIQQFIDELPEIADEAREQIVIWIEEYRRRVPIDIQTRVETYAEDAAVAAANIIATGARQAVGAVTGTVSFILGMLIVPFFMFYAMRDRHYLAGSIKRAAPPELQPDVENVSRMADFMLGRYIRAQLLLGVLVGTAVGIGLTLMGVQLSLALALWAGLTELIPIVGPWIGAIPALIIVAATQPDLFLWVALLYLGIQAAENYLLIPRIQKQAVDVHPAMVLLLLATAGTLWGILGMLVIIPIAAIGREIFWYIEHRLRGESPDEALGHSYFRRRFSSTITVPPGSATAEEDGPEESTAENTAEGPEDGTDPEDRTAPGGGRQEPPEENADAVTEQRSRDGLTERRPN